MAKADPQLLILSSEDRS